MAARADADNISLESSSSFASTSNDTMVVGFADGFIESEDSHLLRDLTVSRIGGIPTFPKALAKLPERECSLCKACGNSMPLLTQICAPTGSDFDRVLYTFACPRARCRGKPGTVRAFRATWPLPPRKEEAKLAPKPESKKADLGNLIFGGGDDLGLGSGPFGAPAAKAETDELASKVADISVDDKKPTAVRGTSHWGEDYPAYPAQYFDATVEPAGDSKDGLPKGAKFEAIEHDDDESGAHREGKGAGGRNKKTGGKEAWGKEGYEVQKLDNVDEFFLHFQERISRAGDQCVRHDFGAAPLPFSGSSELSKTLFPPSKTDTESRPFDASRLPACSSCRRPLVYEYQLVPHLVSTLNESASMDTSTVRYEAPAKSEYKTEKERMDKTDALDFANAVVFTCEGECVDNDGTAFREEIVMIELDE